MARSVNPRLNFREAEVILDALVRLESVKKDIGWDKLTINAWSRAVDKVDAAIMEYQEAEGIPPPPAVN